MAEPTWGIVATVDEPPQLVSAFLAWHLAVGAREIHLFLDRPDAGLEALAGRLPGVIVTVCDAEYWAASPLPQRPARHTGRQIHNANRAYARAGVDWLLHCDADEFLRDGAALTARLAAMKPESLFLQLGVLERVYPADAAPGTIFDGLFRSYGPRFEQWGEQVYGRFAKFLQHGMSGHFAGKAVVRTGRDDVKMDIHFPKTRAGAEIAAMEKAPAQLRHFDGLTPLHLVLKLVRRLYLPQIKGNRNPHGINRGAQMRFAANNKSRQREMARLVQGLQRLTPEQVGFLDGLGLLDHARFDPGPALARYGLDPDLSVAGFDAQLRAREAELIALAGIDF